MIDNFGLLVSHGLIILAVWRLMWRPDLDDGAADPPRAEVPVSIGWKGRKGA